MRFSPLTPYTIAQTCNALSSAASGEPAVGEANGSYRAASGMHAEPFHLQATGLDSYLLYGRHNEFVTAGPRGRVRATYAPSHAAVWRLSEPAVGRFVFSSTLPNGGVLITSRPGGTLVVGAASQADPSGQFLLKRASGCAVYPEANIDATGSTFAGAAPMAQVSGTVDAHAHITAFEFFGGRFHCGRPWHAFGVEYALPNCANIQPGWYGDLALVQNFLDWSDPFHAHHTAGWPNFFDWPGPRRLSYEGDYYKGLERAWMSGLRLVVNQYVDNEGLCFVMTLHVCDDMASVRRQNQDLHALQDYIDAQSGGPGKGFLRIVTDPFRARQVINQGKLAVIEGVEVSDVLGCGEHGRPPCTPARVDARLEDLYRLGVRSFFPIHKFDNAVGGTKMDDAELGLLINLANHWYSGHFWNVATCRGMSSATEHDSQQLYKTKLSPTLRYLVAAPFKIFGSPPLITHDSPPHCNQLGLTPLGSYLINQMIRRHFMIELDHMDVKTAADSLDIIEQRHYSGAVSAHSWDTAGDNKRIYLTGGFVAPSGQGTPAGFIRQWQIDRADLRHSYLFGFGYGSDMNGLSVQDQPTDGRDGGKSIAYPFTSFYGHVSFDREQWGNRVFDLNKDGIANDGMFADWLQALRVNADAQKPGQGNAIMADMFHGAEAYLETWERALGVPATRCLPARETFTAAGLRRAVTLGDTPAQLLLRSGQPSSRSGWSYRYCVGSATLGRESVAAVFGSGYDQVGLVTSTSRGASAGGIAVGYSQKWLTGRAQEVAGDLWEGPRLASGARFIYGTRSGQIRYLAVASSTEVKRTSQLRKDLSVAGV